MAGQTVSIHEDGLQWTLLYRGFDFQGRRVPVIGPQGIFKPAMDCAVVSGKPALLDMVIDASL